MYTEYNFIGQFIDPPVGKQNQAIRQPMKKSSAVIGGFFGSTFQFRKLEIHKVFLHFLNFNLRQTLSPLTLVDFITGYLGAQ